MRGIIGGGLAGLLVAGTLTLPSILPPVMAQDEPVRSMLKAGSDLLPRKIDGDAFVKPDWTVEPWVSTEATSHQTVRKISFGRTEFVTIATTNTGVYSSDGLDSPYVRYPGIHAAKTTAAFASVELWDGGWMPTKPVVAGSFVTLLPFEGGRLLITEDGTCVRLLEALYC